MEDQGDDVLNEHQRRALSTRLTMLDRFFYDVEQLVSGDSPRGAMFELINDLTDEQRDRVISLVKEGCAEIRASRDQFSLEVQKY